MNTPKVKLRNLKLIKLLFITLHPDKLTQQTLLSLIANIGYVGCYEGLKERHSLQAHSHEQEDEILCSKLCFSKIEETMEV